MRLAFLGCGYVANMYRLTLPMHPELELAGVFDRETSRAENMARLTGASAYPSLEALLADDSVPLVLNLTNPRAHFETTRALLEAGKHVYSEKPLAMRIDQARQLAEMAKQRDRLLCSAPCTLMSETAQTLWKAVRDQRVGRIRLAYAEMDDGMVARAPVHKWINEAGTPWPCVDEFETGCTVEHAGYVLTWLCAMFGPAVSVTAFSELLLEDKLPGQRIVEAPDFSVACVKFASGVVARMTNGIYAEHDHELRLFGDDGVLSVEDPRSDRSPVRIRRYHTLRRQRFLMPWARRLPLQGGEGPIAKYRGSQTRDFCRSIADMAAVIEDRQRGASSAERRPYFSTDFAVHITELTLVTHFATHGAHAASAEESTDFSMPYRVTTTFDAMDPLSCAR
jgi:predicted dehydrogenase